MGKSKNIEPAVTLSRDDRAFIESELEDIYTAYSRIKDRLGKKAKGSDLKKRDRLDDESSDDEKERDVKKKQKTATPQSPAVSNGKSKSKSKSNGDKKKRQLKPKPDGINSGVWSEKEEDLLEEGMKLFADHEDRIQKLFEHIKTRSKEQIRKHMNYHKERVKKGITTPKKTKKSTKESDDEDRSRSRSRSRSSSGSRSSSESRSSRSRSRSASKSRSRSRSRSSSSSRSPSPKKAAESPITSPKENSNNKPTTKTPSKKDKK